MAHVKDDALTPLVVPRSSPTEEPTPAEGPSRQSLPRTPPRVWPPVSPADRERVVRRWKLTAERLGPPDPLLEGAA
jgi:hypothetical protein